MQNRNHFIAGTIIKSLQKKKNRQSKDGHTNNIQFERYTAHYKSELLGNEYQVDQSNGAIIDWLLDRSFQKR